MSLQMLPLPSVKCKLKKGLESLSKEALSLFMGLRRFQHCTGHITKGSWKGRGNQYIQLVKVLYCKLPTIGKQLPAFPLEAMPGIESQPQSWEATVAPSALISNISKNSTRGVHTCDLKN